MAAGFLFGAILQQETGPLFSDVAEEQPREQQGPGAVGVDAPPWVAPSCQAPSPCFHILPEEISQEAS